jgi:hypothetical protein
MGARRFNGSNQSLTALTSPADVGLTMACWFKKPNTNIGTLMSVSRASGFVSHAIRMHFFGAVQAVTDDGSSGATAQSGASFVVGRWHHLAGSFPTANSRSVYLDGRNKATNSSLRSISALTRTWVGRTASGDHNAVDAAVPAIWTPELTDAEVALLGAGLHPRLIAPWSLVRCWDLGEQGVEIEPGLLGANDFSLVNAPLAVEGPPDLIYPPHERFAADLFAQAGGVPAVYYRLLLQHLGLGV